MPANHNLAFLCHLQAADLQSVAHLVLQFSVSAANKETWSPVNSHWWQCSVLRSICFGIHCIHKKTTLLQLPVLLSACITYVAGLSTRHPADVTPQETERLHDPLFSVCHLTRLITWLVARQLAHCSPHGVQPDLQLLTWNRINWQLLSWNQTVSVCTWLLLILMHISFTDENNAIEVTITK